MSRLKNGMNSISITNDYTAIGPDATSENCVKVIFYESPERDVVRHCSPKNYTSYDALPSHLCA